ncbi:MAG: hypothetical protein IJX25_02040 [Clostridia bacterium]|nr:hypothetical protein [Clostridia bacterium]MBQ8792412.1 hypothetical protein [Clostridia bacterium]
MLRLINLKDDVYNVDYAIKTVEIEIENAKREGLVALKILHGYGSHGRGGAIMLELRRILPLWKRQGFVTNYFGGDKWSLFDEDSREILEKDKTIVGDCDLDKGNPGITIIQLF